MQTRQSSQLANILENSDSKILNSWITCQLSAATPRSEFLSEATLRPLCSDFLKLVKLASETTSMDIHHQAWQPVRQMLANISSTRAAQGFTPTETALFIFSLKKPIFDELRAQLKNSEELAETLWLATELVDMLGLYTMELYQRSREAVILRQQKDMLELSTPVIQLWDGILGLPLIGTLDSARTQIIMEALLNKIVENNARLAVIDITGVPTLDTHTAQHLIKTVSAARLMGADCIISGISSQIAQTIVHLGIEITDIMTRATMADALSDALSHSGWLIQRRPLASSTEPSQSPTFR